MMNTMSAPMCLEPVEITFSQQHTSDSIVTTLYDLIAAIQDVVDANDNAMVVATLRHLLGCETRRVTR